jgi:chemotaxis protein MotB
VIRDGGRQIEVGAEEEEAPAAAAPPQGPPVRK